MRWKGKKGKLWEWFSRYTRLRDFKKYHRCISCNNIVEDWRMADAGHYISVTAGGLDLTFEEKNVNLQCKRCNNPTWSPDAPIGYGLNLDQRYGYGTAAGLYQRSQDNKKIGNTTKWTSLEYDQKIAEYKAKFEAL